MADQVDEIKQKVDIVSIIGERVELKKAGRNYKALCPFHSEKTPSFMVSPELQVFKCFGCGENGDIFSFLEKYEGVDFYEALKTLAERAGVKLQPRSGEVHSEKEKLYEINRAVNFFYSWVLNKHSSGSLALGYLTKDRGLLPETIKMFGLGFSPDAPFALRKYLTEKKKFSLKDIEKTGIFYTKDGQMFDRFRGRVIFPLHDHRGNTCGFAGRILPKDTNRDLAKYINTPETEIYHKSRILYGLNFTKADIKHRGEVVVVEGELDTISSWQVGIKNVVAIKGSALTSEQAKLISRFTKRVVLGLDADFAGDEAARRGISVAESEGLEVRVIKLAGFKDPDEAARGNPDALKKAIENSVSVWDFIIDSVFGRYQGVSGGTQTAKVSREIIPVLLAISDSILQAHYIELVAKRLSVPIAAVIQEMERKKGVVSSAAEKVYVPDKIDMKGRRILLEERLLGLVFQNDPKLLLKKEIRQLVVTPLCKRIGDEFTIYYNKERNVDLKEFSSILPNELSGGFTEIILGGGNDDDRKSQVGDYSKEVDLIVREIKILSLKNSLEELARKIKEMESGGEKSKLIKAQREFTDMTKKLSELESSGIRGIIL